MQAQDLFHCYPAFVNSYDNAKQTLTECDITRTKLHAVLKVLHCSYCMITYNNTVTFIAAVVGMSNTQRLSTPVTRRAAHSTSATSAQRAAAVGGSVVLFCLVAIIIIMQYVIIIRYLL